MTRFMARSLTFSHMPERKCEYLTKNYLSVVHVFRDIFLRFNVSLKAFVKATKARMTFMIRNAIFLFFFNSTISFSQERPNVLSIAIDDLNDWVGVMKGHPQT